MNDLFDTNLNQLFDVDGDIPTDLTIDVDIDDNYNNGDISNSKTKSKSTKNVDDDPIPEDYLIDDDQDSVDDDSSSKDDDNNDYNDSTDQHNNIGTDNDVEDDANSFSIDSYKMFAKGLYEEGIISEFDEKEFETLVKELDSPAEAIAELTRRTIENAINEYKEENGYLFKKFMLAKEKGVDLNELSKTMQKQDMFKDINENSLEDDEELQKKIVLIDLIEKGESEEDAQAIVESLSDTGKLLLKSKKALSNIKDRISKEEEELFKKAEQENKQREELYKQQLNTLKKMIFENDSIVEGIKLNEKTKKELYSMITTPYKQLDDGTKVNFVTAKRLEDPIKYAIIEAYLVMSGVFDGKLDGITKTQKTKILKEFEKTLSNSQSVKMGEIGAVPKKKTQKSIGYLWDPNKVQL